MERIKGLNRYQKGLLIFMIVMVLIFAVIYPVTISRVGYRYNDAILVPTLEKGKTIYTGKIQGVSLKNWELSSFISNQAFTPPGDVTSTCH